MYDEQMDVERGVGVPFDEDLIQDEIMKLQQAQIEFLRFQTQGHSQGYHDAAEGDGSLHHNQALINVLDTLLAKVSMLEHDMLGARNHPNGSALASGHGHLNGRRHTGSCKKCGRRKPSHSHSHSHIRPSLPHSHSHSQSRSHSHDRCSHCGRHSTHDRQRSSSRHRRDRDRDNWEDSDRGRDRGERARVRDRTDTIPFTNHHTPIHPSTKQHIPTRPVPSTRPSSHSYSHESSQNGERDRRDIIARKKKG